MNRSKSIKTLICAAALAIAMLASVPSFATLTQILNPDATYTSNTHLLAITGDRWYQPSSIKDDYLTASFSPSPYIYDMSLDWGSWGAPPMTESTTPQLLFFDEIDSFTITFSKPISTFGLEARANAISAHMFNLEFYKDNASIGLISRNINGNVSPGLLAASSDTVFDKVVISTTQESYGIAINNLRYATGSPAAVPEASTLIGFGSSLAMAAPGMIGWLRRRRA
jgi:hypothetical protein